MEFPRLVYKDKGPYPRKGGSYDFTVAQDDAQLEELLSADWSPSLEEAIDPPTASTGDSAAPTREEIEQKLTELQVNFDRRLGTKKLSALLDETLKAG